MHPNTLAWCNGCSSVPSAAPVHNPVLNPVHHQPSYHGAPMQTAPATGGVGGTGLGNVGVVYPIPSNVYAQPQQPSQPSAAHPKLAAQYAPINTNPYIPPQGSSYGASPGAYGGGYGGYGGYGAATSVGTHGSPSSAVYNPNYNGMNMYGAPAPVQQAPGGHYRGTGQIGQAPLVVAQPVQNNNPSAPPGGYV